MTKPSPSSAFDIIRTAIRINHISVVIKGCEIGSWSDETTTMRLPFPDPIPDTIVPGFCLISEHNDKNITGRYFFLVARSPVCLSNRNTDIDQVQFKTVVLDESTGRRPGRNSVNRSFISFCSKGENVTGPHVEKSQSEEDN